MRGRKLNVKIIHDKKRGLTERETKMKDTK